MKCRSFGRPSGYINPHKATEFDGLSPKMLKLVADEIAEPVKVIFNQLQVTQESEWPKEYMKGENGYQCT